MFAISKEGRLNPIATLNGTINNSVTSLVVSDGSEFAINEYLLCDSEIMKISNIASNTLTIARGQLSSTAAGHTSGVEIFPYFWLAAKREPEETNKWINREVVFETGVPQIQGVTVNPIVTWKLSYSGNKAGYDSIKAFFNARCGKRKLFYWYDEAQTRHKVRFGNDEMNYKKMIEFDGSGKQLLVGYSTDTVLWKVY